jgi:hypothetical protein
LLQRGFERVMKSVFGYVEVAEQANKRGKNPA